MIRGADLRTSARADPTEDGLCRSVPGSFADVLDSRIFVPGESTSIVDYPLAIHLSTWLLFVVYFHFYFLSFFLFLLLFIFYLSFFRSSG